MKKTPIQKLLLPAVLAASLLSFVYLQRENESLAQTKVAEVECVEETVQSQDAIFTHLVLLKRVAETGKKLLSVRF